MTRLFFRFYVGVLFVLFCAWWIQAVVFRVRTDIANVLAVEAAFGGGVRLARKEINFVSPKDRGVVLAELRRRFNYPVELVSRVELPDYVRKRFRRGADIVFTVRGESGFIVTPLRDGDQVLQFGPLPRLVGPSQTKSIIGLGLVLLLAAGAIALLLRPVAKQLRVIEHAASAIASGDFSARVDERKVVAARTLAAAFNNMAGRVETMLRAQRELLQAISHELRTPLSRIHFAIDLVREARDEPQREMRLISLEQSALELDELVDELLRYVRLETSEPQLGLAEVPLRSMLEDLIERQVLVRPSIPFEIDDGIRQGEITIRADSAGLQRALGNVLGNAGRFAVGRVLISADVTPEGTVVHVDDDGPGIIEEDRIRVFDPFVRRDELNRGVGLGLTLVHRIITNHGGKVTATASPLGGCRISLFWPRGDAHADVPQ